MRSPSATPPSSAASPSAPGASWPTQTARIRAGLIALGRRPRGSRRRLHAEHPRDDPGLPRRRLARRRLVVGGPGVRRPQRDRPLRADRAEGAARGRRLPLRRARLRPFRDRRRDRRRDPGAGDGPCGSDTSTDRAGRKGFLGPEDSELALRGPPVRPPPLGPLLVGHHRPAEADRPRPRRHAARAPEEDEPPPRRAGGRPRLLVHDDRLDDVELPRRRPAHRRVDRPLRRQPRTSRPGDALGAGRRGRDHHVRDQRELHLELHEGRASSRPRGATSPGSRRSARPDPRSPRRASTGSTRSSAPTPGCSRRRAAPTSAPHSSAASRPCRSTRASCRRGRSAPTSTRSGPTART